jgi:sulfate transport system substrate-binding protein
MWKTLAYSLAVLVVLAGGVWWVTKERTSDPSALELLNVSYDPTRELWRDLNSQFIPVYEKETGVKLTIRQSHGGSGTQARAIIDGLDADVATLALWSDTEAVHQKGLIADNWEDRLPQKSLPYFSTIVFVVRKGNPRQIKDWPDLVRSEIKIVTPNPKTSGNGKLSLLAAWGSVLHRGGTSEQAREFVAQIYRQVPVLDTGARGATATFAQKNIGDVHLTWENEALLEVQESGGELEVVYPPCSLRAEPYVTLVDANVDRKGTRAAAEAYLKFLYTPEAQEIVAKHFYRPINPKVLKQFEDTLRPIELFPVSTVAANWEEAQEKFFAEGGIFDTIYQPKSR